MTPEEQNVAIAEWLGVKFHKPSEGEIKSGSYYQYEPNYCGDLNTMHEAEEKLMNKDQIAWDNYNGELLRLDYPCHATAAQRAEALLRTIGKWEEKK